MMKKVALIGGLLALVGVGSAFAQGQFPDYPLATASPITGYATTLPLTGNERIPADTMLSGGVNPQTEVISTSQLRAYILSGSSVATYVLPSILTIATLPTCTAALQGAIATVSNGTAYGTGTYGSAVSATGAVSRTVMCTNTGGATTYAWAYN
jgi:hypothetical protein